MLMFHVEVRVGGRVVGAERDDFLVVAGLRMLDEEELLRQALHDWKEFFETIYDESARHAAQDLLCRKAMGVRMIPEQTRPLPALGGDLHFIVELMPGMEMNEHVVTMALRGHRHTVEMQVGRIIEQIVFEGDSHGVADSGSQQWRQIRSVIEEAIKHNLAQAELARREAVLPAREPVRAR